MTSDASVIAAPVSSFGSFATSRVGARWSTTCAPYGLMKLSLVASKALAALS